MLNDTEEADDVDCELDLQKKYPSEFGGDRLCSSFTRTKSGEVSKKDLEKARKVSREVDDDRAVNCIVSVLMLREAGTLKASR